MSNFGSVEEILDYAMAREQEAYEFYMGLADKSKSEAMKDMFQGFALEEMGHKGKLQAVKDGKLMMNAKQKVADLKMSDYLVDVEAKPDMSFQEALIVAMKKEKAAFRLYMDLASRVSEPTLVDAFKGLAQEEAKHKLRFEMIYDDEIMTEN